MGPPPFAEDGSVFDDVFVGCEKNVELISQLQLEIAADLRKSFIGHHYKTRSPFGEFERPISESGERYDNKIGTRLVLAFDQVSNQRNCLNCFAQSRYLVSHAFKGKKQATNPISSARMPSSLLLYKLTIHCNPLIWYSLRVPPLRMLGCAVIFSLIR
jgi:hypothetical protein